MEMNDNLTTFIPRAKFWTRAEVAADTEHIYLFGDNLAGYGRAGQACIRELSNAIGIPTKHRPSMDPDAFFDDANLWKHKKRIDAAFRAIPAGSVCIYHAQIGCGLAEMPERCPQTYAYLMARLRGEK